MGDTMTTQPPTITIQRMQTEGEGEVSVLRGARLEELATSVLAELARAECEVEQSCAKLAATTDDEYGVLRAECRSFVRCFHALLAGKEKTRGGRSRTSTGLEDIEDGGGPLAAHLHELFTGIISKRIASVRQVQSNLSGPELIRFCRRFDGYETHIVSPEVGLREIIRDATRTVKQTVIALVGDAHAILVRVVRSAAKAAAEADADGARVTTTTSNHDDANRRGAELLVTDRFAEWMVETSRAAMGEWKLEAETLVANIIDMHADYVNASYFRERARQRRLGGAGDPLSVGVGMRTPGEEVEEGEEDDGAPDSSSTSGLFGRVGGGDKKARGRKRTNSIDNYDILQGYLSKLNTKGGWQRRWFVLNEQKKRLYYYANQDEHQEKPPRGTVTLENCNVIDIPASEIANLASSSSSSSAGLERRPSVFGTGGSRQGYAAAGDDMTSSLYIKIVHTDEVTKIMKDHTQVLLKVDGAATKYEWLARLREAAQPRQPAALRKNSEWSRAADEDESITSAAAAAVVASKKTMAQSAAAADGSSATSVAASSSPAEWTVKDETAIPRTTTVRGGAIPAENDESFYVLGSDWQMIASDISAYVASSLSEIAVNVPKAIVYCLVRRAENSLLEHLTERLFALHQSTAVQFAESVRERRVGSAGSSRVRVDRLRAALADLQDVQVGAQTMWEPEKPMDEQTVQMPAALLSSIERLLRV